MTSKIWSFSPIRRTTVDRRDGSSDLLSLSSVCERQRPRKIHERRLGENLLRTFFRTVWVFGGWPRRWCSRRLFLPRRWSELSHPLFGTPVEALEWTSERKGTNEKKKKSQELCVVLCETSLLIQEHVFYSTSFVSQFVDGLFDRLLGRLVGRSADCSAGSETEVRANSPAENIEDVRRTGRVSLVACLLACLLGLVG